MFYCSAGVNDNNENSMFFGLAGSGKSIMAIDNKKILTTEAVAWTEAKGIYSLESGITLKTSSFHRDSDEFKSAINKQCIIENPNFDDDDSVMFCYTKTKEHNNTHITFPRENFENSVLMANDPSTVIFLVKDTLGVLPRVSKLNKGQAIYYFLSGYTSTSTGVEAGGVDPKAEFYSCFAQPFLLLKPTRYAEILRQRLKHSNANIYMINVGWIDGNYKTGRRVPTEETKSVVRYLIDKPDHVKLKFKRQKYFNFKSLTAVEDNDEIFYLKNIWDSKSSYHKKYKSLAKSFVRNYKQFDGDEFADKYSKFGPSL
jgi:phosphoenolpyruvate carboxykinase (ATP)